MELHLAKCNFSSNENAGVRLTYGGSPVNFEGCWFENNNTYGLRADNTQQVNLIGCYFENNIEASIRMRAYEDRDTAQLNLFNCTLSIPDDAERCIYLVGSTGGGYGCNLINTLIYANSYSKDLVSFYSTPGEVSAINTRYANKYVNIAPQLRLKFDINNQYKDYNYFGAPLRLNGGLGVGNSVNATTPGNVIKKMEVFDQYGNSIGFVPIYDKIT